MPEQSKVPTRNYQPYGHLVPDHLRRHNTLRDNVARRSVWSSLRASILLSSWKANMVLCLLSPSSLVFSLVYLTSRLARCVMSCKPSGGGVFMARGLSHWTPPWVDMLNHNTGWDCQTIQMILEPHSPLTKVPLSLFQQTRHLNSIF